MESKKENMLSYYLEEFNIYLTLSNKAVIPYMTYIVEVATLAYKMATYTCS